MSVDATISDASEDIDGEIDEAPTDFNVDESEQLDDAAARANGSGGAADSAVESTHAASNATVDETEIADETPISGHASPTPTPAVSVITEVQPLTVPTGPTLPAESPATLMLAAAARREASAATTAAATTSAATTSATTAAAASTAATTAAADQPAVVAIEQTPPLEWLQRIPIIGPFVVTPIVAFIHQVPILSDVLHPLIGFPMRRGLPEGTPVARDVKVISFDDTPIYVHFMPAAGLQAGETAPTILSGPGLALPGATNLEGSLLADVINGIITDFGGFVGIPPLRQAGYNVVTWDPRGEWNSGGQLQINLPEAEGRDVSAIISWLAAQPEARLDGPGDPRMGMVGPSYGGAIQLVAAADDKRVDAIVPSIAYNSVTTALYKAQAFRSSWGTLLTAALTLTLARMNPRIVPAAVYGTLTGQLTPADQDLLADRDPVVADITAPTLLINGTVDTIFTLQAANENATTLIGNGVPTKVVWFCGGHGVCLNNLLDFRDGALIQQRTLEWLDRYVKGDESVSTGPQFEWVDQRGQWYSSAVYPVPQGSPIVASSAGATLPLIPYLGGSGVPLIPLSFKAINAVNLTVPEVATTTYLVGAPELTLTYSGTSTARHVYAQLVDDTTGLVLGGIVTPIPVTLDGQVRTVTVALEPVAHTLAPGKTVTLQLVSSAGLYETIVPSLGVLKVSRMQIALPTVDAAAMSSPSVPRLEAAA